MRRKIPTIGSEAVYRDRRPSGSMREAQESGAGLLRSPVPRLKLIAYLVLLLALIPAATCMAMECAGMPMLFSTVCGVVACAARAGAP
ncbi:hypothetical protein [Janthinobacterium sp. LB2P10]|uniref:hypothetical protein n=1 Tax=Janthinobacterium sp. LB2P10 TaxID=3424194 RepID=UPI003F28749D